MLIYPSIDVYTLCETADKKITLTAFVAGVADDMPFNKKRKAVLICPGGAYAYCSNREGEPIATSFLAAGYNAFVLDYSTKNRDMKGKKFPGQLIEAALAMKFIKDNAEKFHIDPDYVFVNGYSAGGHLAALTSTYRAPIEGEGVDGLDAVDATPNAQILCYPVIDFNGHNGSFIHLLDEKLEELRDSVTPSLIADEKRIAEDILVLMYRDARIGYEAANHYLFSRTSLMEKIINCAWLERHFAE
jgi:acetyl esterase/lipase